MNDRSRAAVLARRKTPTATVAQLDSCLSGDATLSALYAYWRSRHVADALPTRADIDPCEIGRLLPYVGLIDLIDGEGDAGCNFRYRLVGSHMVNVFGRDFTGTALGEDFKDGNYGRFLHELYSEAVATRGAVFCESRFVYRQDEEMTIRRLVMPLAGADGGVAMLLFANSFCRLGDPLIATGGSLAMAHSFPSEELRRIVPLRRVHDTGPAAKPR